MKQILSIQSHVAYGHVGNCAAVFPLQRLGWDVITINTVQFSNHTEYDTFSGEVFSAQHVRDVFKGVTRVARLDEVQALLTGYMGDETTGTVVLDALAELREANPDALYCCDPVMGDFDKGFYVREGLPEWMRDQALPMADIATPNQFELNWLTCRQIATTADALAAAAQLRALGPKIVLVTSLDVEDSREDEIEMLVDTAEGSWTVATRRVHFDELVSGAGDFCSAMFLAGCLGWGLDGEGPARSMARTAAAVQAVFDATCKAGMREMAIIPAQNEWVAATPESVVVERLR